MIRGAYDVLLSSQRRCLSPFDCFLSDSATNKKITFHPRSFGWHLRERLHSSSPFHKNEVNI